MKEEILKRIDALAEKLGQTSGHLWDVLVKQAYIDAWTSLGFSVLFGIFAVVAANLAFVCWRKEHKAPYDGDYMLGVAIFSIGAAILMIPTLAFLYEARFIFNPEAGALVLVLKTLRG